MKFCINPRAMPVNYSVPACVAVDLLCSEQIVSTTHVNGYCSWTERTPISVAAGVPAGGARPSPTGGPPSASGWGRRELKPIAAP